MPGFPATGNFYDKTIVTASFLAAGGDEASVQIKHDGDQDVTDAMRVTWANAAGRLSNAALQARTTSESRELPVTDLTPYDESYSSAGMKLVMCFVNPRQELKQFAIPAPDEQYFGQDGVTVNTLKQEVGEFITATLAILNQDRTGMDVFAFQRGFRSERSRTLARPRAVRPSGEPGLLDVPSGS